MAIPLRDLIERPDLLSKVGPRCHYCGVLLQETITGKRCEGDHEVCSDCYYEKLGQAIEEHPIVGARVHRG
jgi:hypothetical protein